MYVPQSNAAKFLAVFRACGSFDILADRRLRGFLTDMRFERSDSDMIAYMASTCQPSMRRIAASPRGLGEDALRRHGTGYSGEISRTTSLSEDSVRAVLEDIAVAMYAFDRGMTPEELDSRVPPKLGPAPASRPGTAPAVKPAAPVRPGPETAQDGRVFRIRCLIRAEGEIAPWGFPRANAGVSAPVNTCIGVSERDIFFRHEATSSDNQSDS